MSTLIQNYQVSDFDPEEKENISFRENLLNFYNLQGDAHEVFIKNLSWLIDRRLRCELENLAPWSDPITEFEGIITTLSGVVITLESISKEDLQSIKGLDNLNEFFEIISNDIIYIYSGSRDKTEQKNIIKRITGRNYFSSKKLILELDTTLEPFINFFSDEEISIEAICLHIRLLTCISGNGDIIRSTYFDTLRKTWPNFVNDTAKIRNYLVDMLILVGKGSSLYPISYNIKSNQFNVPNSYNTLQAYKVFLLVLGAEFLSEKQSESIFDIINTHNKRLIKAIESDDSIIIESAFKNPISDSNTNIYSLSALCISELHIARKNPTTKLSHPLRKKLDSTNKKLFEILEKNNKTPFVHENDNFVAKIELSRASYYIVDTDFIITEYICFVLYGQAQLKNSLLWSTQWEALLIYMQKLIKEYSSDKGKIGFTMDSPYQNDLRTVSIVATLRGLEVTKLFGIDSTAKTGIIDILNSLLNKLKNDIVVEFYSKFSDLEYQGYRLAWKKIQEDYQHVSISHHPQSTLLKTTSEDVDSVPCSAQRVLNLLKNLKEIYPNLLISEHEIMLEESSEKVNKDGMEIIEQQEIKNKLITEYFISIFSSDSLEEMFEGQKKLHASFTNIFSGKKQTINRQLSFISLIDEVIVEDIENFCDYFIKIRSAIEEAISE